MKTEFEPDNIAKGLYIPAAISDNTSLKDAHSIEVYACDSAILLLNKNMTPWQLVEAMDMLNTIMNDLVLQIESAAKKFEDNCRSILIPQELLDEAGIPAGAPLDVLCDDGEIYITVADEEDDVLEHLPRFLYEFLDDEGLDHNALRLFMNSGEAIYE